MYLKQSKKNGRVYLSIAQNFRAQGKVKSKTVESLGYVDELATRYDDPIAHFRAVVDQMNRRAHERDEPVHLTIARNAVISSDTPNAVSLGAVVALGYLDAFGCSSLFKGDAGRIFDLVVAARMMHAVPVRETWNNRAKFPRACGDSYEAVYRAFERFAEGDRILVDQLNRRYEQLRGDRALSDVRVVLSNYTFPWSQTISAGGPDEMAAGEWGRLCLAIDADGIPLAYRIVPREMMAAQVADLVQDVKAEFDARHVTLVATTVPQASWLMDAVCAQGDGFVFLQPADAMSVEAGSWARDETGYAMARSGSYRIKSRSVLAGDLFGEGECAGMSEAARPTAVKQIAFRATGAGASQVFCIVSNETARSDAAVFNVYRELWRVHEPFQVIPADFIAMPYEVDARIHMKAHFAICYAAFFALRVLRRDMGWRYNAAQVADALLALEGAYLDENWYVFNYRTEVTDAIEETAGIPIGRRLMSREDIRSAVAACARTVERRR